MQMVSLSALHRSPTCASALLAALCASLVGGSFFVQHVLLVEPCPLCIIQRFTYAVLAVTFLAAALLGRRPRVRHGLLVLALLLVLLGGSVAAYQSKLQLFPVAETVSCSPSLSYMLDTLPMSDVIGQLFQAHGDCSDTSFKIVGLTLAQISLSIFGGLLLWLIPAVRRPRS
jgi:protein dithiol:quinone oxidoreductase